MEIKEIKDLAGKNLDGFSVKIVHHVWAVDYNGVFSKTIGWFKDETVAKAFAGPQSTDNLTKVGEKLVLTDGKVLFPFNDNNRHAAVYMNEEEEAVRLKAAALALLSEEQKKLLGL